MHMFRVFALALLATMFPAICQAQSLPTPSDDMTFVDVGYAPIGDFKDTFYGTSGEAIAEFDSLRAPFRGSFAVGGESWVLMVEADYSRLYAINNRPKFGLDGNHIGTSMMLNGAIGKYVLEQSVAVRGGISYFYADRTLQDFRVNQVLDVQTSLMSPFVGIAADFSSHASPWIVGGHADMFFLTTMADSHYDGFNSTTLGANGFKAGGKIGYMFMERVGVFYAPEFYSNKAREDNDGDDKSRRVLLTTHFAGIRFGF